MAFKTSIQLGGKNIKISCEPHIIRIQNDKELKSYLLQKGHGSRQIAHKAQGIYNDYYKDKYGKFSVSEDSMTLEILGHVYPEILIKGVQMGTFFIPGLYNWLNKIKNNVKTHTDIIDIGEEHVDDNRWLWDKYEKCTPIVEKLLID